jgi:hypothetical protein
VSSTVSSDCSPCTYSGSVVEGVPSTSNSVGSCPDAMSYAQANAEVNEVEAENANGASLSVGLVNTFFGVNSDTTTVCEDVTSLAGGPAARSLGSGQRANSAPVVGRDIVLKKCATKAVAPCVKSVVVNARTVVTTVILPVNESVTLAVGPQKETLKKFSPKTGAPGSKVTIKGTNLTEVNAATIGGVQASIVSETAKKLVMTIPPGASTGLITLNGWSGDVTSSSNFKIT